jgi:uncharacterized protein YjgD (DUF1641 family)
VNAVAQPISLDVLTHDPRIELQSRLESASAEHAEALLAAYDVLQGLHDAGAFDLLRGALGSRDKIIDIAVRAAESPESICGVRNLVLLINMLGAIDPDVLKAFTATAPQALKAMLRQPERPGLWRLVKDFLWNEDFRHGLAAVNRLLEVLGKNLSSRNEGATP